jgi:hypothetical protein
MGTLGTVMHRSRTKMLGMEQSEAAELFKDKFGLSDGDFVEIRRWARSHEGTRVLWTKARIAEIEECYFNSVGGYTAFLKVIPINNGGRLGCSRSVMMALNKNGKVWEHPTAQVRLIK